MADNKLKSLGCTLHNRARSLTAQVSERLRKDGALRMSVPRVFASAAHTASNTTLAFAKDAVYVDGWDVKARQRKFKQMVQSSRWLAVGGVDRESRYE